MSAVMVDTRLRGEWLHNPRFDDLSDAAWRMFTLAMIWSNEKGTDGRVPTRYLSMLHPDLETSAVLPELEAAGVVDLEADAIQFRDWGGELGQSTAEEVQDRREKARARQRAFRERQAVREPRVASDVTRDVGQAQEEAKASSPGAYVTRDVTRDERCPKHPNGDTGEPCVTCMRHRQERDARRPAAGAEARAIADRCHREGHQFRPGDLYCNRCAEKLDPNGAAETRERMAVTA